MSETNTHAEQRFAAEVKSLAASGIGRSYASKTLASVTPHGLELRDWLIANEHRIATGYGFDFRGQSARSLDTVMLTGRAFMLMGMPTLVIPLVRLARQVTDADELHFLRGVQCLIIRDFETPHPTPCRPYETADIEALIADRAADARSTSVWRHKPEPCGWWSEETEALLTDKTRVVTI